MSRVRHKAIAIPISRDDDDIDHFLIVRDVRYREWTFVTGGCRRREIFTPLRCALRELHEETRGLLNLKEGVYSYFKFTTNTPEPGDNDADVLNYYHVYIFRITIDRESFIEKFNEEKRRMDSHEITFRKNYDENDECRFETLENIKKCPTLWPMIRTHVIMNQDFYQALENERLIQFDVKNF